MPAILSRIDLVNLHAIYDMLYVLCHLSGASWFSLLARVVGPVLLLVAAECRHSNQVDMETQTTGIHWLYQILARLAPAGRHSQGQGQWGQLIAVALPASRLPSSKQTWKAWNLFFFSGTHESILSYSISIEDIVAHLCLNFKVA